MSRFLFVVPPLTGHTNPTVSVGRELMRRGHAVAWVAHADLVGHLLPEQARRFPLPPIPPDLVAAINERSLGLRGPAALRFLWRDFIVPLARHMVPEVERAVDAFRPDVLIADQQAIAGALVGRRRGIAWATSATTSAELVNPLAELPKIDAWVRDLLAELESECGLPAATDLDLRFSEHLVLGFTTTALVGSTQSYPDHYAFVGPAFADRPIDDEPFPWEWLDARPTVLVSLGTVSADVGQRFFSVALESLEPLDVQAILVASPDRIGTVPDWAQARPRVPQVALLPRLDAVITHGGHNTVSEALAHGLPLVVAPIRDDQPLIAEQVVAAGAGLRVRFGRIGPVELRTAVRRVLSEPSFRQGARRVGESFSRAGGAPAAAGRLEQLARAYALRSSTGQPTRRSSAKRGILPSG